MKLSNQKKWLLGGAALILFWLLSTKSEAATPGQQVQPSSDFGQQAGDAIITPAVGRKPRKKKIKRYA